MNRIYTLLIIIFTQVTQITQLQNEFTGTFSISPDGQWIVFERSKTLDQNRALICGLWE